jgi:hypothetical protein
MGAQAIKKPGDILIAQENVEFKCMPSAAMNAAEVDFVPPLAETAGDSSCPVDLDDERW